MIVAITGGTGFIGRKLVMHYLAQGIEVRSLTRRSVNHVGLPDSVHIFHGGLSDTAELERFVDGVDVLFHCAGEIRNETRMREVHVDGTQHLINAATGRIKRWVQLSSVGAYGKKLGSEVVTEQTPLNPSGIYEVTKVESDRLVSEAALAGAFEYVILRPSNVYGVEMSNQSLFGLIEMIRRGLFFFIGEPGASANYIHVDNVIAALVLCGEHPDAKGRVFNLSDFLTIEKFVEIVSRALGKPNPGVRLPESIVRVSVTLLSKVPGFPLTSARVDALTGRASYSIDKISSCLNYKHIISFESGLIEMTEFMLNRTDVKQ